MKWVLSHLSDEHQKWELHDAPEPAQLTYNLQHQSLRIRSKTSRLFFLESSGRFQKKLVLRSEYGIIIGEAAVAPQDTEASLTLNDTRFYYRFSEHQFFLLDKNHEVISMADVDQPGLPHRMTMYALLFGHAWIVNAQLDQKKSSDRLVA